LSVSPLEADKSFSIVAVKMPQTAHYKRQNKFMQIAAVAAAVAAATTTTTIQKE